MSPDAYKKVTDQLLENTQRNYWSDICANICKFGSKLSAFLTTVLNLNNRHMSHVNMKNSYKESK